MKKIALVLALAAGIMVTATPALAAKPAPPLPPGGTITEACPGDEAGCQ